MKPHIFRCCHTKKSIGFIWHVLDREWYEAADNDLRKSGWMEF